MPMPNDGLPGPPLGDLPTTATATPSKPAIENKTSTISATAPNSYSFSAVFEVYLIHLVVVHLVVYAPDRINYTTMNTNRQKDLSIVVVETQTGNVKKEVPRSNYVRRRVPEICASRVCNPTNRNTIQSIIFFSASRKRPSPPGSATNFSATGNYNLYNLRRPIATLAVIQQRPKVIGNRVKVGVRTTLRNRKGSGVLRPTARRFCRLWPPTHHSG
ncbi:hypothetical protein BYT27DRAFT_7212072 [Phlegmacium glaucopus]|nr:hypothetical protein BYT27DRAFT_7212072 [Phlegmacium glaucopus]